MLKGDLLTPFQKKVLKAFTGIEESKAFYLTGGTALSAFYLGHRLSEDFDLFTAEEPLISVVARKLKSALENSRIQVEEIRTFSSFWEGVAGQGVESIKIQLAYDSPFMLSALVEEEGIEHPQPRRYSRRQAPGSVRPRRGEGLRRHLLHREGRQNLT